MVASRRLALAAVGLVALVVPVLASTVQPAGAVAPTGTASTGGTASPGGTASTAGTAPPIFAYYYLWWSTTHWHDKLGSAYPYTASPLPLPATLDSTGCAPVSRYPGNQLTDVPTALQSQDDPANLELDVRQAAAAGLRGFVVNWIGTGTAGQTPASASFNARLDNLVAAAHKVEAEGTPFTILFSLEASASIRTGTQLVNDISYLADRYGSDPAVDHSYTPRLPVIWTGSRKYATSVLASVSTAVRQRVALYGDETSRSWTAARAAYLDGDHYYWSSQDPVGNPQSFAQLRTLAATVRASVPNPDGSRKTWLAPLTPGIDTTLLTGSAHCVPRRNGQTLIDVYRGNATTNPDGYTLISWNEIAEATYIKPMQRYGTTYTDTVRGLVTGTIGATS